ncbi:type I restriction enzyme HsdR N-terminal domain-containing protein [Liquorilactobacillus satsumensis]|uniref:Restriction endonuclease type I HsdR N-terminal domain-containing protein n=1 Tax=Liquorilactobacillus satsumensis DSM 16230 = JCM 12392 TaxID=1423801 RepID=A0A0R1UZG2_9LACO|nr:type I restriction endonuclease [Liquorilactobacillus satsumensis]KRL98729.1 hypothetical protein FD50_GL000537 [Liquorilactobacillus satsumensis DSM 16230 = JCM 12392]MCP9311694.1 type I restriction enzyme HsdR N-terminal domain-containing protein [Liquorilactobacillus satsumensis]MCP9358827.1 type I restriction enzyme HsdR N-terminal domain-containing protein [Liquorilactobacillus satsumensis]
MEKDQFISNLKNITKRVMQLKDTLKTEEATKTSLIMPFFQALGYDVFNPMEFVPEFIADFGIKKGEKVDYAIVINEKLQMLIEAKGVNELLTKHDSQLFRYFGTTDVKFSILTNGEIYEFFTDLEKPNKMDATPFLTVNLSKLREAQINELFKFTKDNFDVEKITSTASELKYVNQVKEYIDKEQQKPSVDFTKYIMGKVYEGRKTENAIDEFKPIISKAIAQFITEKVNDKLSSALNTSVTLKDDPDTENKQKSNSDNIETTPEEIEAYATVKIILKDVVEPTRLTYRDNLSYFNVLLDDNIRKWILRVFFTNAHNFIVLNNKTNTKLDFSVPTDLVQYAEQITNVVKEKL